MGDIRLFEGPRWVIVWLIVISLCACVGKLQAQTTEVASDDFNRPDGPIGTNWAYPAATETSFFTTNDEVEPSVPEHHTEAYWTSNNFANDQYSQIKLTSIGPWTGVLLRADTNQDEFFLGFVFGPNDYRIYAYDGYTNIYPYFSLATGSATTWQVGDTMKMEVSGSNAPVVTMYQNGTPVLVWRSGATDPMPIRSSGGNPGIGIYSPIGDPLTLDDWQGGNLIPDTNAPSIPANLVATVANPSVVDLSWTSSTDDVAVVGYVVERSVGAGSTNFAQIGMPTGTSFSDTTVVTGATNNYLVMAMDAAGNLSGGAEVVAPVAVSSLPMISTISNQTTPIGISVGPFPFYISDAGYDPYGLSVTAASSNTNVVPNQNMSIFNLGSTRALTVIPADGQTGTSIITVTVGNGINSTNTSFLFTVNPAGNGTNIFANSSNIVTVSQTPSTPYPSSIDVSGEVGTITNVIVTFHGMNDAEPGDLNALLVGPGGQAVVLMTAAIGNNNPMSNLTFTLSDQTTYPLPVDSPLLDGNFQPTDYATSYVFPSPAPPQPYATHLSAFDGLSPNGTWSLYVSDEGSGDNGQIAGGWSLAITTVSPPTINGLTDQSTPVNTPTAAIPFTIEDCQTTASNLVLTVTSSNPALVNAPGDIAFSGSDTNRSITVTPEPNIIGTSTISVIVTDTDGMSATNGFLITVNQGHVTVTGITAVNKVYDGTTPAMLNLGAATLIGEGLNGSDVTLNTSGASGNFSDANVGTNKAVQITGLTLNGNDASNYILTQPASTANIMAQGITISSGLTANSKVYDGTTAAMIASNMVVLSGVVVADVGNVNLSTNGYAANFVNAGVGNGIAVNVSGLSLTGSASTNYVLSAPNGLSANIMAQGVTISSGLTANSKVYDGTTSATIASNTVVLSGVVAGDAANVSLSTNGYVANFASAGVGNGIAVNVSGLSLSGSASTNYVLTAPNGLSANITAQGVTISSGMTANSKVYDGTTAALITSNTVVLSGVVAADAANVSLITNGYVANFASAGVGNDIAVAVSGLSLTGSASTNYVLSAPNGLSANITAQGVTISSGMTANSKVYDGTTAAMIASNTVVLSGVVAGDVGNVSLSTNGYVASFASADVGNGIAVTVSGLSLTGSASTNYALSAPEALQADITPATLTVTANDSSRTYGLPNPPLTVSYHDFVNGEGTNVLTGAPSLSTSATISSPAGTYAITVDVGSLSATNYSFNFVNGTLTVVAQPQLKAFALKGSQIVFTWPTITNQTYELNATTNLNTPVWTPMGDSIMGTGNPVSVTNTTETCPQQYFRLSINQ